MNKHASPQLVTAVQVISQAGLIHRVQKPIGDGPFPTVVMLHGRSGNEDVMWVFAKSCPPGWLLVAPRAIKPDADGGYAWHPRSKDEWPSLDRFDEAVTAVTRFIHALPALYQADLQRVYLMGFSQGAATAYATAMRHPELVQGIAGLVGFVPEECGKSVETAVLRDLPVFMAVGREDQLIPYERAQACAQTLRAAGADLTYREYDTGHRLNASGMHDLKDWWSERA
ncbi:MAG: dienelactone hydrolase family protein [Ardenticatenaceae bacterium]|nr:dienelactone hydrolase family protein [Ardenticatenaceae bacterium]